MEKNYVVYAFIWFIGLQIATAQITPFSAIWNFEGSDNGSSSSGLVNASSVSYSGVNKLAVNPYTSGYVNLGVNVQNWSTTICNQTEYVQFSVQPTGTATITLTTLSFAFTRSAQGPQQLTVRSSVDGYSSDLSSQGVTDNYQVASISLNGSGFSNQSSAVTFRIYACNPSAGGGTLKLDEIRMNATALPVTLLSFTAKPEGDRVQLAWTTLTERDAKQFIVERSYDLGEYITVGEVDANGTTNERQYYGLTDLNPRPGSNYYRLSQLDLDGTIHSYKIISAIVRGNEPVVAVYPNPASPDRIHIRLWNVDDAAVRLLAITGQVVDGRLERKAGEADLIFDQPLPTGLYWLEVQTNGERQVVNVIIR